MISPHILRIRISVLTLHMFRNLLLLLPFLCILLFAGNITAQNEHLIQDIIELERQEKFKEALSLIHKHEQNAGDDYVESVSVTSSRLRLYQRLASNIPITSKSEQKAYLDSALSLHATIWESDAFSGEQKRILSGERTHLKDRLLGQAKTFFNEADFTSSVFRLEQTLTINKKDTAAVLLAAYAHYNLNNYDRAFSYLNQLEQMGALSPATVLLGLSMLRDTQAGPDRFSSWASYGEIYTHSEVFEAKYDSIKTDFWTQTGARYLSSNKKDSALISFRQLLPTNDVDVIYSISLLMFEQNNGEAFDFTRKYSEIIEHPEQKAKLLQLVLEYGNPSQKQWLFNQSQSLLKMYPESSELHLLHGLVLEEQGDDEKARTHFQKAIDLDAENQPAVRAMGISLYQTALASDDDAVFQKYILESKKYLSYAQYLNPDDDLVNTILTSIQKAEEPIKNNE